jgi:3-phenylpropionate/trans-cinnamate dioxygenase ferredoxin reductase subunit
MTNERSIVIVGASLAGAKAAEALRTDGFTGRILLCGEEAERPYERPPLSKGYLRGEEASGKVFVHDETFYDRVGIELRQSCRVEAIEPAERQAVLAGGERIGYDQLLLTTGAAPRRLRLAGADLPGVHYLRNLGDSDHLREAIQAAGRIVVIGGGWIGCEVAASARQLGAEVAMVEVSELPLERVLGPELGGFYRDVHADAGVELHLGIGVEALRGSGSVEEVVLADGTVLAAPVVAVGVGVSPRTELAEAAGLTLDNGVVTDEYLATSVAGIYAAGDVAAAWHPVLERRIRLEHWSSALNQGPTAAANMIADIGGAKDKQPYTKIPYFFSDQYDVGMEYSGLASSWDRIVYRGDPATRQFIAFWLADGRVQAGMNVNIWDVAGPIADIVASRQTVDAGDLADPEIDLAQLASKLATTAG